MVNWKQSRPTLLDTVIMRNNCFVMCQNHEMHNVQNHHQDKKTELNFLPKAKKYRILYFNSTERQKIKCN